MKSIPDMVKKLMSIQSNWEKPYSIEINADDSSDEEESEEILKRYSYKDSQPPTLDLSFVTHVIGLSLYSSREVNTVYYEYKKTLLSGSELCLTQDNITQWVNSTIDNTLKSQIFPHDNGVRFFNRYIKIIWQSFFEEHKKSYEEAKQPIIEYFKQHPHLLTKLRQLKTDERVPLALQENFKNLFLYVSNFITSVKIDYEKMDSFSDEDLIKEIEPILSKDVKQKVKEILNRYSFLREDESIITQRERKKYRMPKTLCKIEAYLQSVILSASQRNFANFFDQNKSQFLSNYISEIFKVQIENGVLKLASLRLLRGGNISFYKIFNKSSFFDGSFFGNMEEIIFSKIRESFGRLSSDILFQKFFSSLKDIKNCISTLPLDRKVLNKLYSFVNDTAIHPLVFVRLSNRSQTRLIRQRQDTETILKIPMSEETNVRSICFPCIDTCAVETQVVSCKNTRSDKVNDLCAYDKIYDHLSVVMKLSKADDAQIAKWLRDILSNKPIQELLDPTQVCEIKVKTRTIRQFLGNLTYLLFITEPARNPSCWIIHQMMLDLIIGGHLSWKTAFSNLSASVHMPMAIPGAVQGGRALTCVLWKQYLPRHYEYQGDTDMKLGLNIREAENVLIRAWFQHIRCVPEPQPQQLLCILQEEVVKWYGVKLELNLDYHTVTVDKDFLPYYASIKEHLIKFIEKENVINLVAEYAYEPSPTA